MQQTKSTLLFSNLILVTNNILIRSDGNNFPFLGCADLRSHVAATGGSGGFHDLDPAKADRNGTAAFLGKSYCDRLDVGGVLSAEAAADLQWYQLDLGG